jgi:hypothetical protein
LGGNRFRLWISCTSHSALSALSKEAALELLPKVVEDGIPKKMDDEYLIYSLLGNKTLHNHPPIRGLEHGSYHSSHNLSMDPFITFHVSKILKVQNMSTQPWHQMNQMLTGDSTRHIQMLRDGFSIFGGNMDSRSRCEKQEEVRESCLTQENFL